jgi:hypothetical protein
MNTVQDGWWCFCRWGETVSELWPPVGLLFIPRWYMNVVILRGRAKELREEPVPMPLCPQQIPCGLTRASAVRGRRLSAWAMARPYRTDVKSLYWRMQLARKIFTLTVCRNIFFISMHLCSENLAVNWCWGKKYNSSLESPVWSKVLIFTCSDWNLALSENVLSCRFPQLATFQSMGVAASALWVFCPEIDPFNLSVRHRPGRLGKDHIWRYFQQGLLVRLGDFNGLSINVVKVRTAALSQQRVQTKLFSQVRVLPMNHDSITIMCS